MFGQTTRLLVIPGIATPTCPCGWPKPISRSIGIVNWNLHDDRECRLHMAYCTLYIAGHTPRRDIRKVEKGEWYD